ncbi:MAG: glycine--tRNA ligase subunit beta [Candidatus Westeberhardia cardiocondylae]|nr:glycine--tRNA ligase subunit beta [Candidatus Westeberhardia cardiocondylae]
MKKYTFLMEIGTEEIPYKILRTLSENFFEKFSTEIKNKKIKYKKISWLASPRRIAIKINKLQYNNTQNKNIEKSEQIKTKFNNKKYENIINNNKINQKICNKNIQNNSKKYEINNILFNITKKILTNIKKFNLMRWGNGDNQFIIPIHTITLLINKKIISGEILKIQTNRIIQGHRFMGKNILTVNHAKNYQKILFKHGKVIADFNYRKKIIQNNINKKIKKYDGKIEKNNKLLNEVTSITEWPIILIAKFKKKFLKLPKEILTHIIQDVQKCFLIFNKKKILPYFIFISNIESNEKNKIISGYEQTIHSRLQDANFFFKEDRKLKLIEYLPKLNNITFKTNLGSLREKTNRIQILSENISKKIQINTENIQRAAILSKCDLVTNMVTEFPKTQGIIGMHYAKLDNEPLEVYLAQKEQYQPKFFNDNLPTNIISSIISIADKIDTLTGTFIVNTKTTYKNDPFHIRRISTGILQIIIEKKISIDLKKIIIKSIKLYKNYSFQTSKIENIIMKFMFNRLYSLYKRKGYKKDIIKSVLSQNPTNPTDFNYRIQAINYLKTLNISKKLITINKRIINILKQSKETIQINNIENITFNTNEEIQLAKILIQLKKNTKPLFLSFQYIEILNKLIILYEPTNALFKNVKIFTKNKQRRINRLTLLNKIRNLFLKISDITLLQ